MKNSQRGSNVNNILVTVIPIRKGVGTDGNWRTNRDYTYHSIVKIGQNPEKSHEDMRRLVITQTPVKDSQLSIFQISKIY